MTTTRKRNLSLDAKNKIYLPCILNDGPDLDPQQYLKYLQNKSVRNTRTKSIHQPIQVKYKLEVDKEIVYALEDQFAYKKEPYTNKLSLKTTKQKDDKLQDLINCYCQKLTKKKPSSQLKKLDLDFL